MKWLRALLAAGVVACAACGSDSPAAPAPPSNPLTGGWTGSVTSTVIGTGALNATLIQNGTQISGTWTARYANPSDSNSGSLTGTIVGNGITILLTPSVPTFCPYTVSAVLTGATMAGSYATANCTVALSGGFVLSKIS